jgi:hypothetical protein
MPHDLTPCPCGDTPELGESQKRLERRAAAEEYLQSVGDTPPAHGPARRNYELTVQTLQRLHARRHFRGTIYSVSCTTCGRWIVADGEEMAVNRWNKAVAKLSHLQACCQNASDRRVDDDGMVLLVCDSPDHDDTIHGRRHFPLEPDEVYDVRPSDAEDDAPRHRGGT